MIDPENITRVINPEHVPAAIDSITSALHASFKSHPMRGGVTRDELTRRLNICIKILGVLVRDALWSPQRAFDHMQRYLIAELNGESWQPTQGSVWLPS